MFKIIAQHLNKQLLPAKVSQFTSGLAERSLAFPTTNKSKLFSWPRLKPGASFINPFVLAIDKVRVERTKTL